jgi:hypothetical protein
MRQSQALKAPSNRAELDALIALRGELQTQLRALESRRFGLAVQRQSDAMTGQLAADLDRRIGTIDAQINELERVTTRANALIAEAHANPEIGQERSLLEPKLVEAVPPPPPATATGVPPFDANIGIERVLAVEGIGFLLFGAIAWFYIRRLERRLLGRVGGDPAAVSRLQQSVDAIAIEVERISENQRYLTKFVNDRSLGAGEARPIEHAAAQPASARRDF